MRPDLHAEITRRLEADFKLKKKGNWLQKGRCPDCQQNELYAKADKPWLLKCGRENNCGAEIHVKDLYRDLFESWSDRYPVTEADPSAAADAYLQSARGFPLERLKGLYSQEWYQDRERNIGTATVRFPLACGTWWERLIDRPERFGKQKARFAYGKSHHGHWWQMPDSATDAEELWLAEGVFDAIALELAGKAARSLMSCNNYPEHALKTLADDCRTAGRERPVLVWALDVGAAGERYTHQWIARATADGWNCKAAQPPQHGRGKTDWNDLHLSGRLNVKTFEQALYLGALLMAPSAAAKALLMYQHGKGRKEFHFGFENRLWWFKLDVERYDKAMQALEDADQGLSKDQMREAALHEAGGVIEIANCYPVPLYYQANALTDESWYYYRISFPHKGKPLKNTFTAGQLASSAEFKKRLLGVAPGAVFTGSTAQIDRILKESLFAIKTVETVPFIGYAREHGCYVFGEVAVKDGVVHMLNDEDYFDVGKLSIKSLNQSLGLSINLDRNELRTDWVDMIWQCYGPKGLVALTFWLGALFSEQIRAEQQSFPFLEMSGEPGTGKTTLIDFLWKLVGRSGHEGMDPSKSTLAGRTRHFTQIAGLPVVLIESDRDEDTAKLKRFDWEELKPLYNGHIGRSLGVKNSGNDTYDPPFRGAVVVEQNAPVTASNAIMERFCSMTFDKALHTAENKEVADRLAAIEIREVSGFVLEAVRREKAVVEAVGAKAKQYAKALMAMPEMKNARLAKNHGQMMALVDALRPVTRLNDAQYNATHSLLAQMAIERQQAINADHPHVQAFWEIFDHLDGKPLSVNGDRIELDHSRDPALIAVNLVEMESVMAKQGLRFPTASTSELKRLLRTSRVRKFVENKAVNSRLTPSTKKCWVFQRERS